ncbi:MAG TPA: hypothetical protein VKT54_01270 [Steroidobacteraceae bacterium]|nr:hypothetical protein [Steroidobacteraceae bacterium]
MSESKRNKVLEGTDAPAATNRRRLGTIVHDDRGNASVEWHDAPADEQRPVLEILGDPQLTLQNEETYDPYARHTASLPKPNPGNTTRTDLRKLSEWIKMKRELEARKLRGGDVDDEKDG